MNCPNCQSGNVLAERHEGRGYRRRYYRGLAIILDHLMYLMDEQSYREDGAACECMNCGYKWRPKQEERRKRYTQILTQQFGTVYRGVQFRAADGSMLQLEENQVVLYSPKGNRNVIAYDEIATVAYQKNLGPLYGWLSIRDRVHVKRRMPKNFKQAKKDCFTIFCDFGYESACYQTYLALKAIAEENKKAGLIW